MDEAKIRLSPPEMDLVTDPNWILTKNSILEKVKLIFGELHLRYSNQMNNSSGVPEELLLSTPKISRGENYKGLPWVMLDYPRNFGQQDTFAIRTFFWWGNFFSITLQLSGQYMELCLNNILRNIESLKQAGVFICVNEDPWEHHFGVDNYIAIRKYTAEELTTLIQTKKFIKLAGKLDLKEWNDCTETMNRYFKLLTEVAIN